MLHELDDDARATEREEPVPAASRGSRAERWWWVSTVLGLVAITTWLYGVHVFDGARILNQPNHDWAQEVWFLAWPAYALSHGLNPLFSSWQNAPVGLNLMVNTSMPLLGIVLAPITWLLGPTVTYSFALRLGMVTSACAAQFVGRRLGLSRTASTAAGLLYAFSAMEIVEGDGHVFLTFVAIPPLLLYVVYRAATGRLAPTRAGVVAGVLLAAQALISLEVALMVVVTAVAGLVVGAVVARRALTAARVAALAHAFGVLVVVCGAVLALPLATYFGRGHFWGPSHPTLEIYRANLASIVVPGHLTWLSPIGVHLPNVLAYKRENGAYLGVPLAAILLAVAWRGWRVPLVRVASLTLVVLVVLALGTRLDVTGSATPIPLPFALLARLPFLDSISPVRFFILIGLLAALLGGWGLDRAIEWARSPRGPAGLGRGARTTLVALASGVVACSLLPPRPYASAPTDVPAWLDDAVGRALVPDGSVVLFYPYPSVASSGALLDQAVDGFRYRIVGGQGVAATAKPDVHAVVPLPPLALPSVFLRASTGELAQPPVDTLFGLPPLPPLDASTVRRFRAFVTRNGVTVIAASDVGTSGEALVERYLVAAFGAPTLVADGTWAVWPRRTLDTAVSASRSAGDGAT